MKQIKNVYAILVLLFLSLAFSSCYIGYYEPGPRYRTGPRYRPARPHYHAPARQNHHNHHHGHGRGRW
ncbi:MAG: hypothetical protein V4561_12165 [Bacteroidota bacterium]